ncbi:MAG: beta-N-acetylhexosaminidase [Tessaracoccus sp.]|uniref:family 20 glycosylhydrolase n=1 Tax=Tessaracoccus sp. TaxID=1971211 RepID=UPI001EB74BEA|nr:family 20 glycosylhydrolase [Tessaracoccus sp.]MBK7821222.1 beta-N-acetylhexosaminidase [Tessaracoccus sp.]
MSELHLVPAPSRIEVGDGAFPLADAVASGPLSELLAQEILTATGSSVLTAEEGATIELTIDGEGAPESYRLTVAPDGVRIAGADRAGLRYGVFTLAQLARRADDSWVLPAVVVEDAPRFRYRGLMLDVARHFFDVATVKKVIDRAARLKLNALHLHLSDDQGWRIEIPSRPELTEKASPWAVFGAPGGFYTQADYAEIVAYAGDNDMVVVPEVDLPGHTHAIGLAYPDLVEEPVITAQAAGVIEAFGGGTPAKGEPYQGIAVGHSSLRIRHEPTYEFLADVLSDLAGMTPGPWLHVGGDECHSTAREDFASFVTRVSAMVRDLGKTPVVWLEAGDAELAPGTIGQFWGLRNHEADVAEKSRAFPGGGGALILSPADCAYLDMKYDADTALGLTWADGPTSVERSYDWEPSTLIEGVSDDDVLGVEAPLWTETVATLSDIDHLVFPRIASAAEIGWSPARGTHPLRTWESFAVRLGGLAPLWDAQGVAFHRAPGVAWSD